MAVEGIPGCGVGFTVPGGRLILPGEGVSRHFLAVQNAALLVRQNIQHFEHLLGSEPDPRERAQLEGLLSEPRRELKALEGVWA